MRGLMGLGVLHYKQFSTERRGESYLADISPVFGVWHLPNVQVEQTSADGDDIHYRTNEHGMRDRPRAFRSDASRRVVALGDSMIEGAGVEAEDRMTDLLEAATGDEHLNFGTSGNFGPIQEWLLYGDLARKFDHTAIYLFCLPDNDFHDNNAAKFSPDRYRPYLRKTDAGYEAYYTVAFEKRFRGVAMDSSTVLKHQIYNRVRLLNAILQIDLRRQNKKAAYDDFSDDDAERLLYTYRRIAESAAPRPVTIFIVPRHKDFLAHDAGTLEARVVELLKRFAAEREGVEVYDLMPYFLDSAKARGLNWRRFYLVHDGHWSPLGHRVAAEAVLHHTKSKATLSVPGPKPR